MTGFLSPKVRNKASWVTFGSKPTTEPIFTKIGLGGRTGPYIRIRRFLMDGLLKEGVIVRDATNNRDYFKILKTLAKML